MNGLGHPSGISSSSTNPAILATRLALSWSSHSVMVGTLLAAIAGQAFLIFSGIAVARLLDPEDRGNLQLLILAPVIVGHIGTFGLPLSVTYFVSREPSSASAILALIAKPCVVLTAALSLGMVIAVAVSLSGADRDIQTAGFMVVFAVPGSIAQRFGLALLQGEQRFRPFNFLRTLQVAIYACAAVALLIVDIGELPWVVAIWTVSTTISGAATLLFAAITQRTHSPTQADFRTMFRFGSKSLIGALSPVEMLRIDHIALALVAGPVALGFYVVGTAFSNLPRFIAQSVGMVAYPKISSSGERALHEAAHYVIGVTLLSGAIILPLAVSSPWLVPRLFGSAFEESIAVTQIALIAAFLFSVRRILTDCARAFGWPGIGSIAEVTSSVITILLIVILGAHWGATGAAWGLTSGAAAGLATLAFLFRSALKTLERESVRNDTPVNPILGSVAEPDH